MLPVLTLIYEQNIFFISSYFFTSPSILCLKKQNKAAQLKNKYHVRSITLYLSWWDCGYVWRVVFLIFFCKLIIERERAAEYRVLQLCPNPFCWVLQLPQLQHITINYQRQQYNEQKWTTARKPGTRQKRRLLALTIYVGVKQVMSNHSLWLENLCVFWFWVCHFLEKQHWQSGDFMRFYFFVTKGVKVTQLKL